MGELSVRPWKRNGHDRLYVFDSTDERTIGYYDRKTGALLVDDETRRYDVVIALRPHLGGPAVGSALPGAGPGAASGTTPGAATPPTPIALSPAPASAQSSPSPAAPQILAAAARALRVALLGDRASAPGAADAVEPGDHDLAANAAGAAAAARAAQLAPRGVVGLVTRVFGIETEATSWRVGARGEAIVGRRLERLERRGWRVLHAIPLPSGADIDHLVIGPAGVFTVNTKYHRDARITVGSHVVWVNGYKHPYLRNSLHEASAAGRRLAAAIGTSVQVTPVLAFLGASSVTTRDATPDVVIALGETVDRTLRAFAPVLDAAAQERIITAARREATWRR